MFRRTLAATVFMLVTALTWTVFTPVRAQMRVQSLSQQSLAAAPLPLAKKELMPSGAVVVGRIGLSANVRSFATETNFVVELLDHQHAVVRASVALGDQDPDQLYLWVLRIKSEDNQTLQTARYENQLFEVTPVREMSPTYHDVIVVPQGKSWVRLTLYRFSKILDPAFLNDEVKANHYSVMSRSQQVESL